MVLRCPVTQEERNLIEDKMKQLHATKIGAYLRKMAIDGYVIYRDDTDIKEMNKQLQAIGRNINQIARKLNSTGNIYSTIRYYIVGIFIFSKRKNKSEKINPHRHHMK